MSKKTTPRCPKTIDLERQQTDEEKYWADLKKAVDKAFENLKPVRQRAGMKE
jgi:uncharacterized protein YicC (UPF0701 family)